MEPLRQDWTVHGSWNNTIQDRRRNRRSWRSVTERSSCGKAPREEEREIGGGGVTVRVDGPGPEPEGSGNESQVASIRPDEREGLEIEKRHGDQRVTPSVRLVFPVSAWNRCINRVSGGKSNYPNGLSAPDSQFGTFTVIRTSRGFSRSRVSLERSTIMYSHPHYNHRRL